MFLLENFDPSIDYKNQEVISLDPVVSYLLQKNKIEYKRLEDYCDESYLRSQEGRYFFEQLDWFRVFDNFLKEEIAYCREFDIPLAKANYLRIKQFVDTIIANSIILHSLFEKKKMQDIIYVHTPYDEKEEFSIFEFKLRNRAVFSRLLQLFCKSYNIKFVDKLIYAKSQKPADCTVSALSKTRFIKSGLKIIYCAIKYNKIKNFFVRNPALKGMRIFFMHAGSPDIDIPIREALGSGAIVYTEEKNKAAREDAILRYSIDIPQPDTQIVDKIKQECWRCASMLNKDSEIIAWINKISILDVSSLILPVLKYFIMSDSAYILQQAEKMNRFYRQNGIGYVFARGNTDRNSVGSLIAAKYMRGAKSICVQHSNFTVDMEVFGVFETETYNYIFARDDLAYDYFRRSLDERYKTDCKVAQLSHYLMNVEKRYSSPRRRQLRESIGYVPKKFSDRLRCFNDMNYPLVWYFDFQKRLVDFFCREDGFDFIYKHALVSDQEWAINSTIRCIKDKDCTNISIYNGSFLESLKLMDRVVIDFPSGAFTEACVSGKPVLGICASYLRIPDKAKEIFGRSLQQFLDIEEAVDRIRDFLHGNPKDYIVDVPFSRKSFSEVMRGLADDA